VATVGVCLGFLPYNIYRARMFMGDSGAMLLGFLLATAMISLTGQIDPSGLSGLGLNAFAAYLPILLPLAVMALPLLDLVLAYVRRTLAGKLWYQADKMHLHHRMLNLGHSHARAVALLWMWSALLAYGMVLIGLFPHPITFVGFLLALGLAVYLTWARRTPTKAANG